MPTAIAHVDDLLRGRRLFDVEQTASRAWWWSPVLVIAFSPVYGALMGSLYLGGPDRLMQVLFSAVKMPLLLFATTLVCLPAFIVVNTVLGLRDDLRESLQAIFTGQAALSLCLASLGPLTRFWYCSTDVYRHALLFNAGMFALATIGGQLVMLRYYKPLIDRRQNHRYALSIWIGLYVFVGIQMGWMLRPFVGAPDMPVRFFRQEPFSNAYIVVKDIVFGM